MKKPSQPAGEYLNVDLEVRSRSNLTPLVEELSRSLCDLHAGRIRGTFLAVFETCDYRSRDSPDVAIKRMAEAVSSLRPSTRKLWREAWDRVFDIGIKSLDGSEALALALRTDTLKTIAKLNARVAITLYPAEKRAARRKRRAS